MRENACPFSDVDLAKLRSGSSSRHASTDRMGTVRNGARFSKQQTIIKSSATGGSAGVTSSETVKIDSRGGLSKLYRAMCTYRDHPARMPNRA